METMSVGVNVWQLGADAKTRDIKKQIEQIQQ
jgi:hypothetical protein